MSMDSILSSYLTAGALVFLVGTLSLLWFWKGSGNCGSCSASVLDKVEFRRFPLVKKEPINYNTAIYRFALPQKSSLLRLPTGQHISVRAIIDGKEVTRSYTPTSLQNDVGFFDLVVKSYPNGLLSKWFSELQVGDCAEVRGPKGNFEYRPNMCRAFGMICGGTGLTPMLQIARTILENPKDKTLVSLIFANVNADDILLKSVLDDLASKHPKQFSVYYVLNNAPEGWKGGVGFVTKDIIKEHLPPPNSDIKILLCGPPPMVKAMQQACEDLGFEKARPISKAEDMIFKF